MVDEQRRLALRRAAAETWGEEVADTLVDLVAPDGNELATRQDIRGVLAAMSAMDDRWEERLVTLEDRWDERFAAMDTKWDARLTVMGEKWDARLTAMGAEWDARLTAMDEKWDARFEASEERWDLRTEGLRHELLGAFHRGITQAITSQTRTLVLSQLAALVVIAGLAFGLR
jgi:hypothetical protein